MSADRDRAMTQDYMCECFAYRDGKLNWRTRPAHHFAKEWHQRVFNRRQQNTEAGTIVSGYLMVRFWWGKVSVHRIIFLMHHGFLPREVDHVSGDVLDNRIENLRAASHQENIRNMRTPLSNTSGRKGVSWHKTTGKWAAGIRKDGKWKHLGLFSEIENAIKRRADAELEIYKEFSNVR